MAAQQWGILGPVGGNASPQEMAELRRQQAAFRAERERLDRQNSWMAVPALAPAAVVMSLEMAAARAAAMAAGAVRRNPLDFKNREPPIRGRDKHESRVGRSVHQQLKQRVDKKDGWDGEKRRYLDDGSYIVPDIRTPRDYLMDLKPNTPSGRAAGARKKSEYQAKTGRRTRIIYYDPKKPR